MRDARRRPWLLPIAIGWGAAAFAGWVEIAHVVAAGPVAPGPIAAGVLAVLAAAWPGAVGGVAAIALRIAGRRDPFTVGGVGLSLGAAVVEVAHPNPAVAPLLAGGLLVGVPRRWRGAAGAGLVLAAAALAVGPPRPGPRPDGPNLLLLTVAGVPADVDGVDLPALEAVSRRGTRFEAAMLPTDRLGPNLTALATGVLPWEAGGAWDGAAGDDAVPLAERLREAGWRTAAWVPAEALAAAPGIARGFEIVDAEGTWLVGASATVAGRWLFDDPPQRADLAVDRARRWIARQRRPWFVWVHLHDPRRNLAPPPPYDERYRSDLPARPVHPPAWTGLPPDATGAEVRRALLGTVAWTDAQVARLLEGVEADRTVVAWVGAGTARLGEGGRWLTTDAGPPDWRVPMAIGGPGLPAGRVEVPVEVADVVETLADLAGVSADPSRSLREGIEGGPIRRAGARSVGYAGGWVASVASRHGRVSAGARAGWWPATGGGPVFRDGSSGAFAEDRIQHLLRVRAEALAAEVGALPPPDGEGAG